MSAKANPSVICVAVAVAGAVILLVLTRRRRSLAARPASIVGLEAFASGLPPIIAKRKTISVRDYPFPAELIGKPLLVLATGDPPEGGARNILADQVPENSGTFQVVGVITFSGGSTAYASREAFVADAPRHGMVPGTKLHAKYAGGDGWPGPLPAYGWAIQSVTALTQTQGKTPALSRRVKTLFDVVGDAGCWEPDALLRAQALREQRWRDGTST